MSFLDTNGLKTLWGLITAKIGTVNTTLTTHTSNKSNPHGVTKSQVGLGSVDNVSKADILSAVYPVGSIYISVNETNPGTLFGGTWEAFGQGRTLIGAGTGNDGSTSLSFSALSTGGEYKHQLSSNEMPIHSHGIRLMAKGYGGWAEYTTNEYGVMIDYTSSNYVCPNEKMHASVTSGFTYSNISGGDLSHNNIQPYITTYFWRRTS